MKTKFLTVVAAITLISTAARSGEKDTTRQANSSNHPTRTAWVPEQRNNYRFTVEEGKKEGTIRVLIEGFIQGRSILSIINLRGQERYRQTMMPVERHHSVEIPYGQLEKGVYFIKLDSGDEIRLKKLVINETVAPLLVTTSIED